MITTSPLSAHLSTNDSASATSDAQVLAAQERAARAAAARAAAKARATGPAPSATNGPRSSKRRHPARKSRIAALTLSLAGTGAMTAVMFHADKASAATTPVAQSTMKAGTYTGVTSTNKWGPVQVKITVASGKIKNVTVLQYPNSKPKSTRINERAIPILKAEALAAQSSSIANVSGATYTADSYKVSLQSAIDQAYGVSGAA
jgi:uncharacterized protein with FMN-binding domain